MRYLYMRTIILSLSLLSLSSAAIADWCDGTQWMFAKMDMASRVDNATESLNSLAVELKSEKLRLSSQVKIHTQSLTEQLQQQHLELNTQTIELCQVGKLQNYPLNYQQVPLNTVTDFQNQLRLNLQLISSQKEMITSLQSKDNSFNYHLDQLDSLKNKIALLSQQMKIQKHSPVSSLQFVKQACELKQKSEDEIDITEEIVINDLLDEQLAELKQENIADVSLQQFIGNCQLSTISQQMNASNDWWNYLK